MDLPRVTQSVALAPSASNGKVPVVAMAPVARLVLRKSRRVWRAMESSREKVLVLLEE